MLSQLVGVPDKLFAVMVKQLESASGNPSIDIRLSTEIRAKIISSLKSLGLDPNDTTGEELYAALIGLVSLHDKFLADRLGATNTGDVADLLPRIKKLVDSLNIPKTVWAVKHSTAKRLIKELPPKQVMKQLGYRSVDSLIKRESIDEIMVGIRIVESISWQQKFINKYKNLQASDFENRDINVILMDGKKWGVKAFTYARSHRQNISNLKEMGVVAMLPLPVVNLPGISIIMLTQILYYINEVRTYSTYFKHHQVKTGFGNTLVKTLIDDPSRHVTIAGQHVHWRVLHHYYGSSEKNHPEFFEPHIVPEDLFWRKAEDIIYKIEPALHFWSQLDYVGIMIDDKPLSFNLMDVATNYVNKTPFNKRHTEHMKDSIWNELFVRYLHYPGLRTQVKLQIDHQTEGQFIG